MDQDRSAFIRTMMKEGHHARIIQVLFRNVTSDLHSEMSGAHAAVQFFALCVNILPRPLAQRFQPAFPVAAKFERRIVKQLCRFQRMFQRTLIREQHRCRRDHLQVDAIAVHFLKSYLWVPASRINMAKEAIAHHDVRLACLCVLDPRPVWRAEALSEVRPGTGKEMVVYDYRLHFIGRDEPCHRVCICARFRCCRTDQTAAASRALYSSVSPPRGAATGGSSGSTIRNRQELLRGAASRRRRRYSPLVAAASAACVLASGRRCLH